MRLWLVWRRQTGQNRVQREAEAVLAAAAEEAAAHRESQDNDALVGTRLRGETRERCGERGGVAFDRALSERRFPSWSFKGYGAEQQR